MQRMLAKNYHWSRKTGSHDDNRLYFLYVTMRIVYDLTVLLVDQTAILVAGRLCRCMGTKSSLASQPATTTHTHLICIYIYTHYIALGSKRKRTATIYCVRICASFVCNVSPLIIIDLFFVSSHCLFFLSVFFYVTNSKKTGVKQIEHFCVHKEMTNKLYLV